MQLQLYEEPLTPNMLAEYRAKLHNNILFDQMDSTEMVRLVCNTHV